MDIDNHQVNFLASTSSIHIASDQPSSSTQFEQLTISESNLVQIQSPSASDQSLDLEIIEQPPLDILESEYIVIELLKIGSEMQDLIQLRRLLDLPIIYEEEWAWVKKRATDLIEAVRNKCIRTKTAAVRRFFKISQSAKCAKGPKLLLTNEPFYSEADYVTREARMYKLLKQKMAQHHEEAKAREEALVQRQQALEDIMKKQAEQMENMMNMMQQLKQQQVKP
jgi:hypothetical protein